MLINKKQTFLFFWKPAALLKKRPWHRCFPVNFPKFLKTPFFIEHLWWLLLITELYPNILQESSIVDICLGSKYTFELNKYEFTSLFWSSSTAMILSLHEVRVNPRWQKIVQSQP